MGMLRQRGGSVSLAGSEESVEGFCCERSLSESVDGASERDRGWYRLEGAGRPVEEATGNTVS